MFYPQECHFDIPPNDYPVSNAGELVGDQRELMRVKRKMLKWHQPREFRTI